MLNSNGRHFGHVDNIILNFFRRAADSVEIFEDQNLLDCFSFYDFLFCVSSISFVFLRLLGHLKETRTKMGAKTAWTWEYTTLLAKETNTFKNFIQIKFLQTICGIELLSVVDRTFEAHCESKAAVLGFEKQLLISFQYFCWKKEIIVPY